MKERILAEVIRDVEAQMDHMERGRLDAIEESKFHKGAMASRYDTFKEEAQYLAGGFHARLLDLRVAHDALSALREHPPMVARGSCYAMVEVENAEDGSRSTYFLLPAGGGRIYQMDGRPITVLPLGSPMARSLIGVTVGDEVEILAHGKPRRFTIISVS